MACPASYSRRTTLRLWWLACALILSAATLATFWSLQFAHLRPPRERPILPFAFALTASGVLALALVPLIRRSLILDPALQRRILTMIVVAGLLARYVLMASTPILELDHNRYLWDGGLVAHGFNPYAVAPAAVNSLAYNDQRLDLSRDAGAVFDQITYPELRTIYPPVAQAAFGLAHWLDPWGLTGWRLIALTCEGATLALILALLKAVGRSALWGALYWLSPLVLKETINSAHMEVVVLPLVLGAVLLAVRGRHLASVFVIGLAIGAKIWPVMLAPLLLRPLFDAPRRLAGALAMLVGLVGLFAWPIWLAGLDQTSGFVGFAAYWSTNSAHFPIVEALMTPLAGLLGFAEPTTPGRLARGVLGAALTAFSVWTARAAVASSEDLVARAAAIAGAVVLLSPAQFPWYVLWVLPLAVLRPGLGWLLAAALLPLYYAVFHAIAHGHYPAGTAWIVWTIWLPVWVMLGLDCWREFTRGGVRAQ